MKPPETNDPLDALLREEDAYIEDAGFTARVVAQLPCRRRSWLRPVILLCATLLGCALIVPWIPPLLSEVVVDRQGSIFLEFTRQSLFVSAMLGLVMLSLVCGLFAAIRWDD